MALSPATEQQLITLAIQELPAVIGLLQNLFAKQNPGVAPPTSAEVIAAYQSAYLSSVAKDDLWLAQHPA
jgi:hypothetical protein